MRWNVRAIYRVDGWPKFCTRCVAEQRTDTERYVISKRHTAENREEARIHLQQMNDAIPRPCVVCGRRFAWIGRPNRRTCSEECVRRRRNRARRVRHEARTCQNCGGTFTPSRADARHCSGRCRMRALRARQT
jgi:hypothetical protein